MQMTRTLPSNGTMHALARRGGMGGWLAVAGAAAFTVHIATRSILTAGVDPVVSAQGTSWIPVNALGAAGAALVLAGLPALSARMSTPESRGGAIGTVLLAGSWMFFGVFLSLYGALVMPWIAREAPDMLGGATPVAFNIAFAAGLVAWLAGSALVARETRDRWVRILLPASAVWFAVGSFVIAPEGPASTLAVNLASNMGPVLLAVAVGYAGYRAWVEDTSAIR